MSINLVKGQKIDLTKGTGLTKLRVGLGWSPAGTLKVNASSLTKPKEEQKKKKGFLFTLGSVLRGEARVGDALNSAVDGTRETVGQLTNSNLNYETPSYSSQEDIDIDASVILLENDKFTSNANLIYYGNKTSQSGAVKHSGDNLTGEGEGDDETIYTNLSKIPSNINRLVYVVNIYNCNARKQHFGMIADAYIKIYDDTTGKVLCQYDLSDSYDGYTGIYVGEIYRYNNEWKFTALGEPCKVKTIDEMVKQYK